MSNLFKRQYIQKITSLDLFAAKDAAPEILQAGQKRALRLAQPIRMNLMFGAGSSLSIIAKAAATDILMSKLELSATIGSSTGYAKSHDGENCGPYNHKITH